MRNGLQASNAGNRRVADGLHLLSLDVEGTALAEAHQRPGQYVFVTLPPHPQAPFALANAPGRHVSRYELLLREGSLLPDALLALPLGAPVQVSRPGGPGYPLEKARGRPLLLAGTGSGISPIISVVRTLASEREAYGPMTVLYGARTSSGFAFDDELDALAERNVELVRTVSAPDAGWAGLRGYVQHHLGDEIHEGAVAFLCGQPEMVAAMTDALVERGVRREDVYLNV
jgi:NAD(P)H-flavin reductase